MNTGDLVQALENEDGKSLRETAVQILWPIDGTWAYTQDDKNELEARLLDWAKKKTTTHAWSDWLTRMDKWRGREHELVYPDPSLVRSIGDMDTYEHQANKEDGAVQSNEGPHGSGPIADASTAAFELGSSRDGQTLSTNDVQTALHHDMRSLRLQLDKFMTNIDNRLDKVQEQYEGGLKISHSSHEEQLDRFDDRIAKTQSEMEKLLEWSRGANAVVSTLGEKVSCQEAISRRLSGDHREAQNRLETLQQEVVSQQATVHRLDREFNTFHGQLNKLHRILHSEKTTSQASQYDQKEDADKFRANLEVLEARLGDQQSVIRDVQKQLAALQRNPPTTGTRGPNEMYSPLRVYNIQFPRQTDSIDGLVEHSTDYASENLSRRPSKPITSANGIREQHALEAEQSIEKEHVSKKGKIKGDRSMANTGKAKDNKDSAQKLKDKNGYANGDVLVDWTSPNACAQVVKALESVTQATASRKQ